MKKLDKDALLEEAKRRYPVGTKFKIVHCPENIRKVTSHEKHDNTFVTASDGLHINFISDLIEGEESSCISASVYFNGNWAEIVEEPKVEVKEKIKSTITWKIGDYVVFVEDWSRSKKGNIDKIEKLGVGVIALYLEKEGLASSPLHNDCKLKVFPTLQEAQKFSDELLGKSKTGLRVEDLVEGEIYVNGPDNGTMWCYIIKYSKNSSKKAVGLHKTGVYSAEYCNYMGDYTEGWLLRLATPDEKKWLNTCIKQDKFIEQSELNKYDDEGEQEVEALGRIVAIQDTMLKSKIDLVEMYKKQDEYNEELKYQLTASINTQIQRFNALESSIKRDAKQQKRKGIAIGSSLGIGLSLTLGLLIFQIIKL